jgi:hypothetical protein
MTTSVVELGTKPESQFSELYQLPSTGAVQFAVVCAGSREAKTAQPNATKPGSEFRTYLQALDKKQSNINRVRP